ncbi:MAG: DMT family transporter [Thermodesulfobacteriota bacterium]
MQRTFRIHSSGFAYAIIAAIFFGASVPASKVLLGDVSPWLLAGLLYAGSGLGLFAVMSLRSLRRSASQTESPLRGRDWLWLGGSILFGGVLGPVLLLFGLSRSAASTTSLLLNLESVFTILIAWLLFKEHVSLRVALGALCILLGGLALSWSGHPDVDTLLGPLLVTAACAAWAMDNNLARKISASDPLQIVMLKSLAAGGINITLALLTGESFPALPAIVMSGAIGFVGYGASILCFIYALRHIGTARTGATFAMAPFVGALLSVLFLRDAISWQFLIAGASMAFGEWLLLSERHEHEHEHPELEHEHRHRHDEHHLHEHEYGISTDASHTHRHRHTPIRHLHPHFPDIHHRHHHKKDKV